MLDKVLESCKTDLKQEINLVAGFYNFSSHRSTFSKLEIQCKVGSLLVVSLFNLGLYSIQLDLSSKTVRIGVGRCECGV